MEQTTLQKIIDQKTDQIRIAIEEAIDNGAKIMRTNSYVENFETCYIDGIFTQLNVNNGYISIVLNLKSDKIAKVFEPSKEHLEKLAEQKRAELEELEKQIKEKEAQK